MSQTVQLIVHAAVAIGLIAAAATLSALGHDASFFYGAISAYGGAVGIASNSKSSTSA